MDTLMVTQEVSSLHCRYAMYGTLNGENHLTQ